MDCKPFNVKNLQQAFSAALNAPGRCCVALLVSLAGMPGYHSPMNFHQAPPMNSQTAK